MGNIDISGTSYEIPSLPRAQELVGIFQSADSTIQWTYDDKVADVLSRWSNLSSMSLREQANYKLELQTLIDEMSSTLVNPSRSPATSRATTQEVIQILGRRSDKDSPLIRWAITRLSNIDLSDVAWLTGGERDEVSLELWELLLLINTDTSEGRKIQIHEQVDEIKNLYDGYIADRAEITKKAARETADGNFDLMLEMAREMSLDGKVDKTDWNEVLPRINQEFDAMWIEVSVQDTEKIKKFINAIKKASESAAVWLHSVDTMLESMLSQAESADRTVPVDITINKETFAWIASEYLGEDPMVYGRNFMHSLFPDRVDAGASGEEFTITFESREQVVELVSRIKSELSELQEFDAIESVSDSILTALFWVGGTSLSGLWALDWVILDAAIADFNVSTAAGWAALVASIPLHIWWIWVVNNKLRLANSGVSTEIITWLTNNLIDTIKLYEDAGFNPEEIRNLKTLLDSITLNLPETPAWINDLQFRARYVYIQLQKWRWNPIMDQVRFSAAELWRIIDKDFRITPTTHIPASWGRAANYTWNFAWVPGLRSVLTTLHWIPVIWVGTRTLERYVWAHLWLGSLWTRLINKWPNGTLGWWRVLYTKSESISDYTDEIWRSNRRTRQIFDIIDGIDELSSDENTALKRQIVEVYGWDNYSKLDPLRMYSYELSLLGWNERINLYLQLEAELAREGTVMQIESPKAFHRGMRALSAETAITYKSFLWSFINTPRIRIRTDDQAANILRDAIRDKLGYVPEWLQDTIRWIRENTRKFEKQREAVEKARVEFMRFVDFYPLISDEQEARLTSIASTEKNTAETPEIFKSNMRRILANELGLDVSAREISDFLKKAETESMRMWEKRNNAKVIEWVEEVLRNRRDKWYISPTEYSERLKLAQDFFQWDKTFWQPHLWLIIEDIYLRWAVGWGWIHTVAEVQDFIDRGWSRDVYTYLNEIKRQTSTLDPAAVDSAAVDSTPVDSAAVDSTPVDSAAVDSATVDSEVTRPRGVDIYFRGEALLNNRYSRSLQAVSIITGIPITDLRENIWETDTPKEAVISINKYLDDNSHEYRMLTQVTPESLHDINKLVVSDRIIRSLASAGIINISEGWIVGIERYVASLSNASESIYSSVNESIKNAFGIDIDISTAPEWGDITSRPTGFTDEMVLDLQNIRNHAYSDTGMTWWRTFFRALKGAAT
jgi:hypothetical protein